MTNQINCLCGNIKQEKFISPNGILIDIYGKGQHTKIKVVKCSGCGIIRQTDLPFTTDEQYHNYYKNNYPPVNSEYQEKTYVHDRQLALLRCDEYGITGRSNKKILDVGSGSGAFVDECRDRGFEAYGCEILKYHCQQKDEFIYRDRLENINFPTDHFDKVTCHDIVEHVLNPIQLLKEVFRALKQEGICVIDFPRFHHNSGKHHWKKTEHIWFFTTEQLKQILKDIGFIIQKIKHPIESKTVFYATKPKQNRPLILFPPGVGDSFWSVVKLQSFLKLKNIGLPDIGIVSPKDKLYDGHKRSFPFLEMFPFLNSVGKVLCGRRSPKLKKIWQEAYAREGRIIFENLLGADYFISYNGHLSVGKSLEEIDDLECNWHPPMFVSLEQKRYRKECVDKYGKYIALYFPFYGTYKYWANEFSINNYIKVINEVVEQTKCLPIFVGAAWDAAQIEYKHIKSKIPTCIDLMNKTSAEQVYGLIRGSQGVIGHPSGLTIMSAVLGVKTLILWNDYYNRDFVWNACPPDTRGTTYFAENTKGLTVKRFAEVAINMIKDKPIESRELPARVNPSRTKKNRDTKPKSSVTQIIEPESKDTFTKTIHNITVPIKHKNAKITIACVLKSGGDYTIEYVKRLMNMIARNTTIPYNFVCLSDININFCDSVKFSQDYGGWWSKIELFKSGVIKSERAIYFDLDSIILANIDDLLEIRQEFVALKPWNKRNQKNGLCASGMMAWENNNTFSFLYNQFSVKDTHRFPVGDQEYISKMLAENEKKPVFFQDIYKGIFSYKRNFRRGLPPIDAKVICFHGKPRLHNIRDKWVVDNWV
jgi:2-polyprenyl-3-methyl-5-hydroxy-6-metoxy-1,4-benzoquinol methylase